ncbi:CidA/LrgA family protein [Deinococcus malanensis]|uniref:CidA/LrgA family protein n=1 Tax=Deinococcus malanensis TaxID=1706855 RepID=A0ABQ2EUG5_9DEIO|nr:CidA/LrgA family protein [Deinococcus malanensis]GGK21400.1 CidA/LrgA family protein [Deinococcus malanensis]
MTPVAPLSLTARLPATTRFVLGLGMLSTFAAAGELLVRTAGLPLPGSVAGLALLWAALGLGAVKLHWITPAADGLLGVLGLLFVPATVGFIQFLSAGAAWSLWLLVMTSGVLVGAGVAGVIASQLVRPDLPAPEQT